MSSDGQKLTKKLATNSLTNFFSYTITAIDTENDNVATKTRNLFISGTTTLEKEIPTVGDIRNLRSLKSLKTRGKCILCVQVTATRTDNRK